jgi:hypothetical protein
MKVEHVESMQWKKNRYFRLVSVIKIYSQTTFMIKISLITLDKSHATLVANDKCI